MKKNNLKLNKFIKKIKKIYLVFFLIFFIFFYQIKKKNTTNNQFEDINIKKYNNYRVYENLKFAIIRRIECIQCGFFSNYIVYLGCINSFLEKGFIPIIDLQSYDNVLNGFNSKKSSKNPWEYFFYQPFGYKLNDIKKNAKEIHFFECKSNIFRPNENMLFNKTLINFWHKMAEIYIPIKEKMLYEAKKIIRKFFKGSYNILGILIRGTDYIARKPIEHPIPPTPLMVIIDIKNINIKNNYDWFFIATEDDLIREIFIKEFGYKLKFLIYKKVNYNYKKKQFLYYLDNIKGNIKFTKIYILNMIILSKCIDIISAQTSGAIGVFIFSNGFRYSKVYNLGYYN